MIPAVTDCRLARYCRLMWRVMAVMAAAVAAVTVMACGGKFEPVSNTTPPAEARPPAPAPASRAIIHDLAKVKRFVLGPVRSGKSRGEELTLALAREPDAIEAFTWIGEQSAPVPRLYAYWALRTLAPDRATALATRLRLDHSRIERASWCIVSRSTVAHTLGYLERSEDVRAMPHPRRARGPHAEIREIR